MISRAVVLGGLGQMGTLISRSLVESGVAVTQVDLRAQAADVGNGMGWLQCDVGALGPELRSAVASSDCVFICLPEKITLQMTPRLAAAMTDGSLWVDTLSVKTDVVRAIATQSGRIEALSINPMFAPVMGWRGNPVAVVEVFSGPKSALLKKLMAGWGARLEIIAAEEHDRLTAVIQVATHAAVLAFGATLLESNFDLGRTFCLSTPPHRLLLTLLHRMTKQSPEVYWDIQAYHPLGGRVRQEMMSALGRIGEDAGQFEAKRFVELFAQLRALFESRDELFEEWGKRAVADVDLRSGDDAIAPSHPL